MLVKPESALRRIPSTLDPKLAVFIEGVRVCLEMIEFAHCRLQQTLLDLDDKISAGHAAPQGVHTSAMLDAWSLVDSIHRLTDLAERFPNVKNKNHVPGFVLLRKNVAGINDLRNFIQHLPEEMSRVIADSPTWSVWGALSWCVPDVDGVIRTSTYMCGKAAAGCIRPLINPLGRSIRLPVGLITLTQDSVSVCLSDLMDDVERFAGSIETMVEQAFNDDPNLADRYGADVVVSVSLRALQNGAAQLESES